MITQSKSKTKFKLNPSTIKRKYDLFYDFNKNIDRPSEIIVFFVKTKHKDSCV